MVWESWTCCHLKFYGPASAPSSCHRPPLDEGRSHRLRVDIPASSWPEGVQKRPLSPRDDCITQAGVLVLKAQQHRTQDMTPLNAFTRLHELVNSVTEPPKALRGRVSD